MPLDKEAFASDYPYMPNEELAKKYGITKGYARKVGSQLGLTKIAGHNPNPPTMEGIKIEFPDKKKKNINWRHIIQKCRDMKDVYDDADAGQHTAKIKIDTDKPVIIAFTACWHLGSQFTNYDEWENGINFILNEPNVFMGIVGDLIDNFMFNFKNKRAISAMVINTEMQQLMLASLMEELDKKGKIAFKVIGNHESMFEKLSGSRLGQFLFGGENDRSPFLPHGGVIRVQVGKEEYEILAKHNYRFSSYLNPLHKTAQMFRNYHNAEICVAAHEHNPAMSVQWIGDKKVYLFRTGSFKQNDDFSVGFYRPGIIGTPCVKLFPDKHLIIPYESPELAIGDR